MRRTVAIAVAGLCFLLLLALVIWQGSFDFGTYGPTDFRETVVIWGVSTFIFILTVTLGFMLVRALVRLYIERQGNKEGSRIRSKLLVGSLALTLTPVLFSVFFSVYALNRNLDHWFSRPAQQIQMNLRDVDAAFRAESQERVQAEAEWLSLLPQTREAASTGDVDQAFFKKICEEKAIRELVILRADGTPILLYRKTGPHENPAIRVEAKIPDGASYLGRLSDLSEMSVDLASKQASIQSYMNEQNQLAEKRKYYKNAYFLLIALIALFVLFVAAWLAQILARQISIPISALLGAAKEVRQGNLAYRVQVRAMDELATLVRAFNEMTGELEANSKELEARRRFTEAILESIPTGVISVSEDGHIGRVNRALSGIFSNEQVAGARRLEDLFAPEDLSEIRYLMKRAGRTGAAGSQLEMVLDQTVRHLAVTVSALQMRRGFVLVIEDTSELLRAQKAAAWQEVARRIAHEIKNPLTPISLSADRIGRQLRRLRLPEEARGILEECTQMIQQEVQTVKRLVDEFSQFSRFPAAQPAPADLNEIVESAAGVFAGRLELDGITFVVDLHPGLPPVLADREQMKRVIVNLVDNAAEAMNDSAVRTLTIRTRPGSTPDAVEVWVTDTGSGVSAVDKEKLFLPYFSTKERGTGLGLAIVNHIVTEHRGRVRVEDNYPAGARFIVELAANVTGDPDSTERIAETAGASTRKSPVAAKG
jgi:two-component system, NtrC family, nitrogen regulation sensor histidine kinase NtrY